MALDNYDSREITDGVPITDSANSGLFLGAYDSDGLTPATSPAKRAEDLPESLDLQEPIKVAGWPDSLVDAGRRVLDSQVELVKPVTDWFTGSQEGNTSTEPEYSQAREAPAESALSQFIPSAEQVKDAVDTLLVRPITDFSGAVQNIGRVVTEALPLKPSSAEPSKNVEQTPEVKEASVGVVGVASIAATAPWLAPAGSFSLNTLGTAAAALGEVLVVPAAGIAAFEITRRNNYRWDNLSDDEIAARDAQIRRDADIAIAQNFPKGAELLQKRERGETGSNGVTGSQIIEAANSAARDSVSSANRSLGNSENIDVGRITTGGAVDSLATFTDRSNVDLPAQLSFKPANSESESQVTNPSESQDTKPDKNSKKPKDDGEPPSIVDTSLMARKDQTDIGEVLRAGVGIGSDIGDSKPQFPIGVDPEKKIQIGEPSDDQKIGDPRPEKLHPTVLPVLPDEQKVIVSKINNDVKNLPSNVDLKDLSGTSHDRPPADQGDLKTEVTPLAELLKKNSTFGDPSVRPEGIDFWRNAGFRMSDGDLSNSDQIRKANEQLEAMRRAFNQSSLEQTFNTDHSKDEYRNLLESLGGAVISVEKLRSIDELMFKTIPKAIYGSADTGDQGSGDNVLNAGKQLYPGALNYTEGRGGFLGLGAPEYTIYGEGGEVLGKVSQADVEDYIKQSATPADSGRDTDKDAKENVYGFGSHGRIALKKPDGSIEIAEIEHVETSTGGRFEIKDENGKEIAFLRYIDVMGEFHVGKIEVDPDYRRDNGCGTEMLERLKNWAAEQNRDVSLVPVPDLDNTMTQKQLEKYYAERGFEKVRGTRNTWIWRHNNE